MFDISIEAKAKKMLLGLDPQLRLQVAEDIYGLGGRFMDGKRLQAPLKGYRSWRSDDYRIIYDVQFKKKIIRIVKIGHRNDVYKKPV